MITFILTIEFDADNIIYKDMKSEVAKAIDEEMSNIYNGTEFETILEKNLDSFDKKYAEMISLEEYDVLSKYIYPNMNSIHYIKHWNSYLYYEVIMIFNVEQYFKDKGIY